VLHGNVDLIAEAARMLVETHDIDWITVRVDGRPRRSYDVRNGVTAIDLREIAGTGSHPVLHLEIHGFRGDELVAATRSEVAIPLHLRNGVSPV
jgi:hypothetical protein